MDSTEKPTPQQWQDMIINHVILPRYLPQSKSRHFHQTELKLLDEMVGNVMDLSEKLSSKTVQLFEKMRKIHHNRTPNNISNEINALQPGDSFAMFVRRQNCTFLVYVPLDEKVVDGKPVNVIVSTFPGNLHPKEVYNCDSDLEYNYPCQAIKMQFSKMLRSEDFAQQLSFLYEHLPIDLPVDPKNRNFVSKWLMTVLGHEGCRTVTADEFPVITKKIRDEVLGGNTKDYFRRSNFYMSIKVILQHSLTVQKEAKIGKLLYKLAMLKFLIRVGGFYKSQNTFDIHLIQQLIAKVARRIEKLNHSFAVTAADVTDSFLIDFYTNTVREAKDFIRAMRMNIDQQVNRRIAIKTELPPLNGLNFEEDINQKMPKLSKYLRTRMEAKHQSNNSKYQVASYQRFFIHQHTGIDSINIGKCELGARVFWLEFEKMVLYEMQMNDNRWSSDELRTWSLAYASYAELKYKGNQLFTSRMILVRLKILSVMDQCATKAHPLLLQHNSGINPDIIASLLLPQCIDMKIAYKLEEYFRHRNQKAAGPSSIGEHQVSRLGQSFSSKFAQQNGDMIRVRDQILQADRSNLQQKKNEWEEARERVKRLRDRASRLSCEYYYRKYYGNEHSGSCTKCRLNREADGVKIWQYEHLLPTNQIEQYAVVFELRIPVEIASLRDILVGFTKFCNPNSSSNINIRGRWVGDRSEVSRHNQTTSKYVWLGSTAKRDMEMCHVDDPFSAFDIENTYNCTFYHNYLCGDSSMPSPISANAIKNLCIFHTHKEYATLQWTLNGTQHTQNQVLASQSKCPQDLSLSEYKNFGSLRADGHRLQFRKLYGMIETEALSFEAESVLSLIMQTLWECGVSGDAKATRESHVDFTDPIFCVEAIRLLTKFVNLQKSNWKHPFKMVIAVLIAVRAFEMNVDESVANEIVVLLNCIRSTTLDWIDNMEKAIHEMENPDEHVERTIRLKLISTAIAGALTFFIHPQHQYFDRIFMENTEKNVSASRLWLQFIVTMKNNILMYTNDEKSLPSNLHMFIRLVESIGVNLERPITMMLQQDATRVHDLIRKLWTRADGASFLSLEFHSKYPQILVVETMLGPQTQIATIDIIAGIFLVDGLPVCRLPNEIMRNEVYRWFFNDVTFEVQPDALSNYSSVQRYDGCAYDFQKVSTIIITERTADGIEKELIHYSVFSNDFPYLLVQEYSHWWVKSSNCIEFRKRTFGRKHFSKETTVDYVLDLQTKHLNHVKTKRCLLDIGSASYKNIVQQLQRLEHLKYIHVLIDLRTPKLAKVELVRMNLKFKVDASNETRHHYELESNEFSGMQVSRTQNVGTLFGFNNGVILESCGDMKTRILLIPHGKIQCKRTESHVSVQIDTENELFSPRFFEYKVDEFIRQIKSNNRDYASWFYLAYLHAITSYGQIEPFIGMSGTERAIEILQSAFAWSSAPYEPEAVAILRKFATLIPTRNMNKERQTIDWPNHIWPHAAEDCFVFIAQKLFEDSQRIHGLYFKESGEKFVSTKSELHLNARDHRRCQPLNPNLGVLGRFIEHKQLTTSLPNPIHFTHSEQTQRVCVLYHRQQYTVPSILNLKSFLTRNGTLNGLANAADIRNILNHSVDDNFADLWIRLYDASRKKQFNNEQYALIFSIYSHRGVDIGPILALQAIAMNFNEFQQIEPPSVPQYTTSHGSCVCDTTISDILMKHYTIPTGYYSDEWTETGRQRSHDNQLQNVKTEVKEAVRRNWPCDSINLFGQWSFSYIDFAKANEAVNVMLLSWNNNRRLGIFIDQVEQRLKMLPVSGMNLQLPKYSAFVAPVPKNWPKFNINFKNAIYENLNQHIDVVNEAKNVWRMQPVISSQRHTANEWWSKIQSISNSNNTKHLIDAGLFSRIIPSVLLSNIMTNQSDDRLIAVIGAWAISIAYEQRQIRIDLYSTRPDLQVPMQREIENEPHINWNPCERPEWLLFEIEQNLTIRRIQVEVAQRMIDPPKQDDTYAKHSVMQLNMGEGKTAVIVPILAAVLGNGTQVCQITVLKSLYATNLNTLRQYLGGLLNRRIYTFPCRRDMAIEQHIPQMLGIYQECMMEKGVVLTLPEYRLSFLLKMYESIQKSNISMSKGILEVLKWSNENVRNILDESDAILQPKYQLIYTVGNQMPPDGGSKRWIIAQALLKRVPHHMKQLYLKYGKDRIEFDVNYIGNGHVFGAPTVDYRSDVFTPCRILDATMFDMLKSALIDDFLEGRLDIEFPEIVASMKKGLENVLMNKVVDKTSFENVSNFSLSEQQTILILSGLLRFEVLKLILTKRWRVNYGVDENGRRKMAIPFKAKDFAAEMTEFGHPDVAISFTMLSYYYSGLSDAQLEKVFDILENMQNAVAIYEKWIQSLSPKLIDASIQSYTGVNLDDSNQRDNLLFPLLRHNMHVIDFWLSNVVFPHEMKIFENKLICTAWDLCSDHFEHLVTGFSGTNDTKNILPLPIAQNDLKELENTNEKMREVLLRPENQSYEGLPANISGMEILQRLTKQNIPVLLDAGALMLELNNKEVAVEWLKMSPDDRFDAAVYFDSRDSLQTIDRNDIVTAFDCSVYRENLSRCLVYLDDVHTRGTDLKFPLNWRASVTLAGDQTRDKTVQSCMRMRQLGKNHRISFWASHEADIRIRDVCKLSADDQITNEHVIEFICSNSKQFERTNMIHWTMAGWNYTKKLSAHKLYENSTDENAMNDLYRMCVDNEFVEMNEMYGEKEEALLTEIANAQFDKLALQPQINDQIKPFIEKIQSEVSVKLNEQAPDLKRFTHALDEEQEKELEQELEEQREVERPGQAEAENPHFDERLKQLALHGAQHALIVCMKTDGALQTIPNSLSHTQLYQFAKNDLDAWSDHILVTKDFKTVIKSSAPTCDDFLRPIWWIAQLKNSSGENVLILLSSYECERLLPIFRTSQQSTLFQYRPRLSKFHNNLLHIHELQVTGAAEKNTIAIKDEVQIGIFSGMMYFNSAPEQNAYCSFLGLIPRPRIPELELAFENLIIQPKGFVSLENRQQSQAIRQCVGECKFKNNPVDLAIKLVEAHHQSLAKFSHAAFILIRGIKPDETWENTSDTDDHDEPME